MNYEKSITYKGFGIIPDKLLNYSLIEPSGKWCCSETRVYSIKLSIDAIIIARIANKPQQLKIIR